MFSEHLPFWTMVALYSPIGLIGVWRWSVWLFQKIFSYRYQPTPVADPPFRPSLSVVTPVYNESPSVFLQGLQSWRDNGVTEIIAVIDSSDSRCIEIFQNFQKNFSSATLLITDEPGKRPALARGIRVAQSDIIALVDSDTVWDRDIRDIILAPFADPLVGGVTVRQSILNPQTAAEKLFAIRLDLRYLHEFPYLAAVGMALTCLSGRTAVYRKRALLPVVDGMLFETFLGKPCVSGEDKRLTSLVMARGWKVRFQQNAQVFTVGLPLLIEFYKQNLRWSRNSWRTDLRTLASRWAWEREPLYAYHLIDRAIQPFTLLLGPIFFGVSLLFHHWTTAGILLLWILGSRTVKLWPHLKEVPRDILYVPLFTYSQYQLAVLKIYALLTLDYQSWITRWHTNRLKRGFWELLPSQLATASLLLGIAFFITEHTAAVARETEARETADMLRYTDSFDFLQLDQGLAQFQAERAAHRTATYASRSGETPAQIGEYLNLSPAATQALFHNRFALAPLPPGTTVTIPIDDLTIPLTRDSIMKRTVVSLVTYDAPTNTIKVKGKGGYITLPRLAQALRFRPHLLQQITPKEWILRANLTVSEGVTLLIDDTDVNWLKLASSSDGFVYIRSYNSDLLIQNTKITSWDEKTNAPDTEYTNGRSFIVAHGSGRMDVLNSEIAYLGGPLRAKKTTFGGIYGLSWKILNGTFGKSVLTGSAVGNRIHDNYFGLYAYGATALHIADNEVYNNVEYGIDPHDDSNNLLIENNFVHNNGNHGIIGSKRVVYSTIRNNRSIDNRLHGFMLDRSSNFNLIENNYASGNVNGIALSASSNNLLKGNVLENNHFGIRASSASLANRLTQNRITGSEKAVFVYGNSRKNVIIKNTLAQNAIGVSIRDARANAVIDSLIPGQNTLSLKTDGPSTYSNFIQRLP